MTHDRPRPGTPLMFRWTKWDGRAHWEHECVYLGRDDHGDWLGQAVGWRSERPGRPLAVEVPNVSLIPADQVTWVATFNAEPENYAVYIDVAWGVAWNDGEAGGIDMDLDVVRSRDGRGTWIDDEDEWAEHQVAYGYPTEIITELESVATRLEARVRAQVAPFDDATTEPWFARLDELTDGGSRAWLPRRLEG